MRKPIVKILLAFFVLAVVAVGLYNIPYLHAKLARRLDNVQTSVYYFFHPPQDVVFVPTQQGLLTQTVDAPTLTPTITPLPTELATPTITSTPVPGSVVLSNIIFVDQNNRWNYCGPANLAMALEYWGWKGDPNSSLELRDQIGTVVKPGVNNPTQDFVDNGNTDVNVMPYEMVDFVNDHTSYRALWRVGGDTDLLKRLIAAGFPVIAEKSIYQILPPEGTWQWAGHYAFTTGYDDASQQFTWQDSYLTDQEPVGKNKTISYTEYAKTWRAFDYVFIVVYPPEREAELFNVLGPWSDANWAAQHALDTANQEIPTLAGIDLLSAWFNKGTSYGMLTDYGNAAVAYDTFYQLYKATPKQDRPYRIFFWYQTGPMKAYYFTSRYQDVITVANGNLDTIKSPRTLEESFYWRAMAEYALGSTGLAVDDMRQVLYYHPGFQVALDTMAQWGVTP
jgi:hypothetical protein